MTRVVLVHNPRSGRGRALQTLARVTRALGDSAIEAAEFTTGPGFDGAAFDEALAGADALLIAGGDGTVHRLADQATRADVPIYHIPLGTENLFAREFGMTTESSRLIAALRAGRVHAVDLARCNGRAFLIMCSVGFDASVVRRVDAARGSRVSKIDYARHTLSACIDTRAPRMSVVTDGRELFADRSGLLLVANSRQYAARLDPARDADMTDGLLDVVFLPHTGALGLLAWAARLLIGTHLRAPSLIRARAREVRVECHTPDTAYQLDGEPGPPATGSQVLTMSVEPLALKVVEGSDRGRARE